MVAPRSAPRLWVPVLAFLTFFTPTIFGQTPDNSTTLPIGSCTATIPCSNGACCNSQSGFCGFGPDFCTTVANGGPCTSHCDALAECGPFAAAENRTCPLNVCCSQFGFCGTTEEFCSTGCQSNCNPPAQLSCGDDEQTALHRRIGYYEGWAVQGSSRACNVYPPESISAETLTHVNFAFGLISPSFEIIEMTPGDAALWTRTTALKQRNPTLKVFLSIGGWSFNDPPTQNIFSNLVGSTANTNVFITSALNTLQAYGFDGVDIDWEYPVAFERGGAPADKENFPAFMKAVKQQFASHGYGLTFTAPSSYWYLQHFDLPALLQSADWVNIMTYDLHGTWDGTDPFVGSVVLAHTNLTEIKETMQLFRNVGVDPGQMVMGIGFYGRSFQLATSQCTLPGCPFVSGAAPGICSLNSGTLMFSEIESIIAQNSLTPVIVDADAVKYIVWNNNQWVSYDDAQTFGMKIDYANSICLGGTMIWSVDQDDTSYNALKSLYPDINVNTPSSIETGNQCQITGCGQSCPANYESLTTLTQNPAVSGSCDPKTPARLCCPVGNAPQQCSWRGGGGSTCNAQCNVGEIVLALDEVGDGTTPTCVQGYKAFCCSSGQGDIGDCFGTACGEDNCVSGYSAVTFVKQGSADNGGCEANQAPPVQPHVCPEICQSNNKPVCCQNDWGYTNCHWVGDVPGCFNAVCSAGQVAVFQDIQGDAPSSCTGQNKRTFCCDPPKNSGFLPVPEDWVFPQFSPTTGDGISETATFTVDFDDNTGAPDQDTTGVGSSGETDDGNENDSPFGEVFIASPNPGAVSSLALESDWVLTDCDRSSDQPQTVNAYCSKAMDGDDSGCAHVFIGSAEHTIVRLPRSCGLGPYARVHSLDVHPDQNALSDYDMSQKPANEPVYQLSFDYNFAAIPDENGPVMMRADMTDMPGYWDAIINSAPEEDNTRRRRKRDFHRPPELEKRWFGPFDSWLQKINTLSTGDSVSRNFHWSDTYTIFHQEEQCPNFSSSLDVSVSGHAQIQSAFGYYLEATIVPPAIQECYVYFKAGAGAQVSLTIQGQAEATFNSQRSELASFGFPGLYYPGLLTLGPSLHLYGQLEGQLSMGGRFTASVGYDFPDVDMSFGKKDTNGDEENESPDTSPNFNNQGFDYGLAYNVNLEGSADVHLIPSLQLGLSVLGGAVMDAEVFAEADLYAGLQVTGSVSSQSSAQICINPHYGVNLNVGFTGSVLYWNTSPLSVNLYKNDFTFGGGCFSSVTEPTGSGGTNGKRDDIEYEYHMSSSGGQGVLPGLLQSSPGPAAVYLEHKTKLSPTVYQSTIQKPTSWFVNNQTAGTSYLEKRAGVPFLPGNILCPATNDQISNSAAGTDCSIYSGDPTDLDPDQLEDRMARRSFADILQTQFSNDTSSPHFKEFVEGSAVSTCGVQIDIPGYKTTTVTAYYDLSSPGALSPLYKAYNPTPPVDLGKTTKGKPRLATANNNPIYAREHVYEESLAGLFVDYLEQQTGLWQNAAKNNDFCDWLNDNLIALPPYFNNALQNPNSVSVFTQLGGCYPQNGVDSMPVLEQEANKAKNLAMYDGERQLNNLGTKQYRDITTKEWNAKCSTAKIAVIRAAAGVISYMNDYSVQNEFLYFNKCVQRVWGAWYPLYAASNVDAPGKGNVNVPNLYDNWINTVVSGMAPWLVQEVTRLINNVTDPDTINLSFALSLDNFAVTGQVPQNVPFTQGLQVTRNDLTTQITNRIGNINWLNKLPRH